MQTAADCLITNFYFVHQSWARDESELQEKVNNWGHKNDFNQAKYFENWQNINRDNFTEIKNFHPVNPNEWESFEYIESKNIKEFIGKNRIRISTTKLYG